MPAPTLFYVIGIVPHRLAGVERFAAELATQVGSAGWRLVLCFEDEPPFEVRRLFDAPHVTLAAIPRQSRLGMRGTARLATLLREHRPRVFVYAFNGVAQPYPWIARAAGVPRVFYNDHTSFPAGWQPSLRGAVRQRSAGALLDGVIAVSRYVQRRDIALRWTAPERVHAVYNGVDLGAFRNAPRQAAAFRARYHLPKERKIVTQVGWLIPEKGPHQLLEAAPAVLARVPDAHFVFVGEGDAKVALQRIARERRLEDRVTFTGTVSSPTTEGVFAAADVCCQLSQWEEAFGLTIAEAMSFERPVVGTRTGAIPELVADGKTGFVVDRTDVLAMVERIVELLDDPAMRLHQGRAGRSFAEEHLDLRRNVGLYLQILGVGETPS